VTHQRLRDSEIFFAALLALAVALTGSRALGMFVAEGASAPFQPSLVVRFGPATAIANFSTFFVLLPVALAFIAIGIPFALRTVAAAWRRELQTRERNGVVLAIVTVPALLAEARMGGSGLITFTATAALAYWQLWPALVVRGGRLGDWSSAVAGAAALVLAYYEWRFLGGGEPSRFIAPTFLVIAFYAGAAGLALRLPVALALPRAAPVISGVIVAATLAWLAAPQLRGHATSVTEADSLEFMIAAISASVLLATGLLARRRG
jgi:hypothetical protein